MLLVMWLFVLFKSDNAAAASNWSGQLLYIVLFLYDFYALLFKLNV